MSGSGGDEGTNLSMNLSKALTGASHPQATAFHIPQLCVTPEQSQALKERLEAEGCSIKKIPIEWVVDVLDTENGWFIATAYEYNDVEQTVHVMVPDRLDPTWEGDIPISHKVLRLVECCDTWSIALFRQIAVDGSVGVCWDVMVPPRNDIGGPTTPPLDGLIDLEAATAHLLLPMWNYLVVQPRQEETGSSSAYFVTDLSPNLKLVKCRDEGHAGRSAFYQLAKDGTVSVGEEALEGNDWSKYESSRRTSDVFDDDYDEGPTDGEGGDESLETLALTMRDLLRHTLATRNRVRNDNADLLGSLRKYLLEGDLLEALRLSEEGDPERMEEVETAVQKEHKYIKCRVDKVIKSMESAIAREGIRAASSETEQKRKMSDQTPAALETEREQLALELKHADATNRALRQRVTRLEEQKHNTAMRNSPAMSDGSEFSGKDKPKRKVPWSILKLIKKGEHHQVPPTGGDETSNVAEDSVSASDALPPEDRNKTPRGTSLRQLMKWR